MAGVVIAKCFCIQYSVDFAKAQERYMSRIIFAFLLVFSFGSAHAYDLFFTVSYQSYPIAGASGNQGRDVIYEQKVILIKTQDDGAEIMKIKNAYMKHVKETYPGYIERVMKSKDAKGLDQHLFANINVAVFGSAAKAKNDIEANMKHASKLGFTAVKVDRFKYLP